MAPFGHQGNYNRIGRPFFINGLLGPVIMNNTYVVRRYAWLERLGCEKGLKINNTESRTCSTEELDG